MSTSQSDVYDAIDEQRPRLETMARCIWETPELGLHEEKSASLLMDRLAEDGFDLDVGVGGMPTAFVATYGSDGESDSVSDGADAARDRQRPTIGILGEYDALPGLSQRVSADRDPVEDGEPGHGCGHNLFGVAGVGAAIAVKRALESGALEGEIRFYGCPAEETLVGKVFMAREGVFDDLDAALTWHPWDLTTPRLSSTLALDSIQFTFEGVSAHAAASPESGRSALDAVQLLNTGVEYVREHVPESTRIHYVVTDGGDAPNVVPADGSVWYYVRAPDREEVEYVSDWVTDVAEAAATMTRTAVDRRYVTGCWNYLPNRAVTDAIQETMADLGGIDYTDEDRAFASDLQETIAPESVDSTLEAVPDDHAARMRETALYGEPIPPHDEGVVGAGSSDVGDVSWITPTGQFRGATWPVGTPAHSWQAVAANGDFGTTGAAYAAKVLAGAASTLLQNPATLERARAEFEKATADGGYESPLPPDAEPPFDVALE